MNTPLGAPAGTDTDFEKAVADYLLARPDFFDRHPALLAGLEVPHASGRAVSLIERQVSALREENRALKARFNELVAIARDNEDLGRRLRRLALTIMQCGSAADVATTLETALLADFNADCVLVRVYAAGEGGPFAGSDAPERPAFAEVLASGRPACGRLKRAQHEALFGTADEDVGSAVVLPLAGAGWDGLLVIAARDARRFHPDLGLDLLSHLGEVAGLVIGPWVLSAA